MEFKEKRRITLPVLKFEEGKPHFVRITSPMFQGKAMKARPGEEAKEPATLVNVVDLETGEEAQIVVNAVLKSVLSEEFADNSYNGKCFKITKMGKQPGRNYNKIDVVEIDDPAASESGTPHKGGKGK